VISLTARIRPTSRAGVHLLKLVSDRLRDLDHVVCAADQLLVNIPGLGTVLVTETPAETLLNLVARSEDAAAPARATVTHEVDAAIGSRAAAKLLTVTWTREESIPALLR
jgi:hypothetical protein